ncbi:ABC-2 family transporter protein [uncultured archaeon]|nr:ABC-2 family transporter protein [uncultured archaeon]
MTSNSSVEKPIDFRKIYAIIKKNWMVLSKDPLRLRMLIMFPMVMILIFGYTAGKAPTNIPAAIVDYDHSQTSENVQAQLYSTSLFSINHQFGSQDEGRKAIESGSIKILFIIPPDFEKDIQSGKTAVISIIVDESDPTVAQMTRASTNAFMQKISKEITISRLNEISAKALSGQQYIATSSGSSAGSNNDARMARIESNFRDAKRTSSGTDTLLSSTIQGAKNSLGYVYDPNEIADIINNGTYDSKAAAGAFAAVGAKQSGLQQIAIYQGMQGANAKLFGETAGIYSDSKAVYANAAMEQGALKASYQTINSAKEKFGEISDDAKTASTDAIALSEIQPYGSGRKGLDFLIPSILALIIFQGAIMGMGRAIAGERKDGSLTRVFLTPTSNITIIAGTLLFYIFFETMRSSIIVFVAMLLFGVTIKGSIASIVFIIWIYAAGATSLGMILSVLSKSQEQYMAFSMLVSLPSTFLSGAFLPIETMPATLQGITRVLPITYAADALRGIMIKGFTLGTVVPDIIFLAAFALLMLTLSVMLFKRELI